ncbi:FAD-dependent oxidoreductase [Rhodobacteraceae bacterium]|nr:FAD-dependent oxidoreductase [Paracoccaceae bacterium]
MSFDHLPDVSTSAAMRPKVAIVGGGISGLAAAWALRGTHDITVFEAAARFGGHARTVMAGKHNNQPVDTGFIVFNYANYPHLTRLFADLEVPVTRSDMSFGATIADGKIEYALRDLRSLLAQKRNLARPRFLAMVRDILRFNRTAVSVAKSDEMTVDQLIDKMQLGTWFRQYYLLPICGAIWSTPSAEIGSFPARSLLRFFENHALLSANGQHQWWTVKGGSVEYVRRLTDALADHGVRLCADTPVGHVERFEDHVLIQPVKAAPEQFDEVIFACHSDQALALLAEPSAQEQQALSAIRYRPNLMVLHADPRAMPKRKACWSSWVYQSNGDGVSPELGVTYWMNRLQNIPDSDPLFVTLNPQVDLDPAKIYDTETFAHPVFDGPAIAAQKTIAAMQGQRRTWFAGAWLRHGFHEDGFASAMRVARGLRARHGAQTGCADGNAAPKVARAQVGKVA